MASTDEDQWAYSEIGKLEQELAKLREENQRLREKYRLLCSAKASEFSGDQAKIEVLREVLAQIGELEDSGIYSDDIKDEIKMTLKQLEGE